MLDLLISGATVVDGTGAPAATADVGVKDGRIVEVGRITGAASERIDGRRCLAHAGLRRHPHPLRRPGQLGRDLFPSIHHGVTTLMMGNCGVGFAPLRRAGRRT
jgi:N-acyl-D-aspartate/D-glutamate deacylase